MCTDDPVAMEDKTVIDMGDTSIVHVQPEFQAAFKYTFALFSDDSMGEVFQHG